MTAHVAHNSGNNEWYTPSWIIESARNVLGSIDTDPASNDFAQSTVKATTYYTADNSGLDKQWYGNVWMNPPYSSALIKQFASKLVSEYNEQNVKAFITLTNNATETQWFRDIASVSSAMCFLSKRVRFVAPDGSLGKQPLQGQVLSINGTKEQTQKFIKMFNQHGIIVSLDF